MQIGIDYALKRSEVIMPAEKLLPLERSPVGADVSDAVAAVRDALNAPAQYPPLRQALTPDDHVALVIDEHLPRVAELVAAVLDHIAAAGVAPSAVTMVCAPSHSHQSWVNEIPDAYEDVVLEVHDPNNRRRLAYLATTKAGRRIYLNRTVIEADQVVVLSGLHFDPAHGYVGPADFLYPALSDNDTQHAWEKAVTNEPPADEPWPLRREAEEVLWLLGAPFLVQLIPGAGDRTAEVITGSAESAVAGRLALDRRWRATVQRRAELVVASITGDPAEQTADDLAHAWACAARVVAAGGAIVLLSGARPELGEALERAREFTGPSAALAAMHAHPPADYPAAYQWLRAAERARLFLLSDVSDEQAEELFVTPLADGRQLQRLIDAAETCLILPDAHRLLAAVATED